MAGVGWRYKEYTGDQVNIVPATKSASAVTVTGARLHPFEGMGWGGATVTHKIGDTTKHGANLITINTYVSLDDGDSWLKVDGDTTTVKVDGTYVGFRRFYIPFAPRVRVDYVYSATATLSAGHGVTSTVTFQENDPEAARSTIFDAFENAGDSQIGDTDVSGGDSGDSTDRYGDTLEINHPNKMTVWSTTYDTSKVANTWTASLQGSENASNWWTMRTLARISVPTTSATYPYSASTWEVVEGDSSLNTSCPNSGPFPKYARIWLHGDSTAEFRTGHGIKFYVLTQE